MTNRNVVSLWKFNPRSGLWDPQRVCAKETAGQWLAVFQKDEPKEAFQLAKHRPKTAPVR